MLHHCKGWFLFDLVWIVLLYLPNKGVIKCNQVCQLKGVERCPYGQTCLYYKKISQHTKSTQRHGASIYPVHKICVNTHSICNNLDNFLPKRSIPRDKRQSTQCASANRWDGDECIGHQDCRSVPGGISLCCNYQCVAVHNAPCVRNFFKEEDRLCSDSEWNYLYGRKSKSQQTHRSPLVPYKSTTIKPSKESCSLSISGNNHVAVCTSPGEAICGITITASSGCSGDIRFSINFASSFVFGTPPKFGSSGSAVPPFIWIAPTNGSNGRTYSVGFTADYVTQLGSAVAPDGSTQDSGEDTQCYQITGTDNSGSTATTDLLCIYVHAPGTSGSYCNTDVEKARDNLRATLLDSSSDSPSPSSDQCSISLGTNNAISECSQNGNAICGLTVTSSSSCTGKLEFSVELLGSSFYGTPVLYTTSGSNLPSLLAINPASIASPYSLMVLNTNPIDTGNPSGEAVQCFRIHGNDSTGNSATTDVLCVAFESATAPQSYCNIQQKTLTSVRASVAQTCALIISGNNIVAECTAPGQAVCGIKLIASSGCSGDITFSVSFVGSFVFGTPPIFNDSGSAVPSFISIAPANNGDSNAYSIVLKADYATRLNTALAPDGTSKNSGEDTQCYQISGIDSAGKPAIASDVFCFYLQAPNTAGSYCPITQSARDKLRATLPDLTGEIPSVTPGAQCSLEISTTDGMSECTPNNTPICGLTLTTSASCIGAVDFSVDLLSSAFDGARHLYTTSGANLPNLITVGPALASPYPIIAQNAAAIDADNPSGEAVQCYRINGTDSAGNSAVTETFCVFFESPTASQSYCKLEQVTLASVRATVIAAPPASTTSSPSLCPLATFCNSSPDESGYLLGPSQPQTYLLFSGQCVAEYIMDFSVSKITLQTSPQLITTYFPAPGGPTAIPPITLSYVTLSTPFQLNFLNQQDSSNLQCTADSSESATGPPDCPSPSSGPNLTGSISASTATSASSQLNVQNNQIYQYVIDSTQTNLQIMDESFTITYESTVDFLSGQALIKKITAIQVIVDLQGTNVPRLAVFGTGADGITPYVGYADVPLDAVPGISLTTASWPAAPRPLQQSLVGCQQAE